MEHQYIETKSGKTDGNMAYKEVMCADCGEMKRLHEDGRMEKMENKMDKNKKNE